jgi:hypothetical protein
MVRSVKNTIIDQKPKTPIVLSDTAKGNRKAISKSKIMKRMATK